MIHWHAKDREPVFVHQVVPELGGKVSPLIVSRTGSAQHSPLPRLMSSRVGVNTAGQAPGADISVAPRRTSNSGCIAPCHHGPSQPAHGWVARVEASRPYVTLAEDWTLRLTAEGVVVSDTSQGPGCWQASDAVVATIWITARRRGQVV